MRKKVANGEQPHDRCATTETIPLEVNPDGVIRISGTRVTLNTLIAAFSEGATAEEIAHNSPSCRLPTCTPFWATTCGGLPNANPT